MAAFTAKVERGVLVQALAALLKVIDAKVLVPVYGHVLVRAEGGALVLTGSSGDLQATARLDAEVTGEGACTIPAQEWHDYTAGLAPGAVLTLDYDPADIATVIKAGRSRLRLPGHAPDRFALFDQTASFTHRLEVEGATFAHMAAKTKHALSTEETRFYLTGLFVHVGANRETGQPSLYAVAADGKRLARAEAREAAGLALDMPGIILPKRTVEAVQHLGTALGKATLGIDVGRTLVRIEAGSTTLVSKFYDATYPDYERVIPFDNPLTMVAPAAALAAAVKRVANLAQDKYRTVRLLIAPGVLGLSAQSPDGGAVTDEVEVEYDGPAFSTSFNARWLAEIIANTGGDTLTLLLSDGHLAPALIRHRDGADALYVLCSQKG